MEPLEIIILIAAIALVLFTVVFNVRRRIKRKPGCGCECGSCPGCAERDKKPDEKGE
jgi:hypothetical protein